MEQDKPPQAPEREECSQNLGKMVMARECQLEWHPGVGPDILCPWRSGRRARPCATPVWEVGSTDAHFGNLNGLARKWACFYTKQTLLNLLGLLTGAEEA